MIISIAISGDRLHGMAVGIGLAFLTLNIFFATYLFKSSLVVNSVCGVIVTAISIGIVYFQLTYKIKLQGDMYGVYSAVLAYSLSSLICWELTYQALNKITTSNRHRLKR